MDVTFTHLLSYYFYDGCRGISIPFYAYGSFYH